MEPATGRSTTPNASVGSDSTRLITVRGGSGSGKTTLAATIRAARPAGTVAVLGQDVIRREILGVAGDAGGHPVGLIDQTARYLLDQGLDVIVEGVLHPEHYAGPLRQLVADHHGVSRSYAYDLPFDETVRRHATRPLAAQFGPDEMRRWWRGFEPIPGLDEHLITTAASLEATVTRVLRDCWPVGR